ncbi:MAG: SdrD B-like domain-containing protein [Chloroflexota bacterium]
MFNRLNQFPNQYRVSRLLIIALMIATLSGLISEAALYSIIPQRISPWLVHIWPDASTAHAQATGPGGVVPNLDLWLRADAGTSTTSDGATVAQWDDQSGKVNHGTNGTASQQPTYRNNTTDNVNFNPIIDFDGNDRFILPNGVAPVGTSSYNVIAVAKESSNAVHYLYGAGAAALNQGIALGFGASGILNHPRHSNPFSTANNTYTLNTLAILGFRYPNTVGRQIYLNNRLVASDTDTASNIGANNRYVGASHVNTLFLSGEMSEMIIYADSVTLADLQRIESYLALKYGITLSSDNDGDSTTFEAPNEDGLNEGNYVSSQGTIVWDAAANSGYHNSVAGLGEDNSTALNQRIARSANADGIITVASNNDFTSANIESSRTSLGDGNFMVWGNNGLDATSWVTDSVASGYPAGKSRLTREWMVQETGSVGAVHLQINVDDPELDLPMVEGVLYLLVDSDMDGDFGDESAQTMTAQGSGLYTINDINFVSGQRFTFATPNSGIRGVVFLDNNVNGQQDTNEEGLENIVVTAVDANGVMSSTVTAADGSYVFMPEAGLLGSTRLVFTLPSVSSSAVTVMTLGDDNTQDPTVFGQDSQTNVNFVNVGDGWTVVNTGFAPKDRPSTCEAPTIATTCYSSGPGAANSGLFSFDYPNGINAYSSDAASQDMGAVWANAHDSNSGILYSAAVLKRHVGLGPLANFNGSDTYTVDGVYVTAYGPSGGTFNSGSPGFTLQGVNGIDLGTVQRTVDSNGTLDDEYEIRAGRSIDLDAFAKVGTVGFGGADIAPDGALWLVNLNQRQLIRVDTAGLPTTGAAAPAGNVTTYPISDPGCTNGDYRPWALTFYGGKGYLGIVCSAETSQNRADLHVYIRSFDPNAPAASVTNELDIPLDYDRQTLYFTYRGPIGPNAQWNPWIDTWQVVSPHAGEYANPQPILSDIEFTIDGDMILGFMDRWGHQTLQTNLEAKPLTSNPKARASITAGDIAKVCTDNAGGWILEGDAGCPIHDPNGFMLRIDGPGGINAPLEFFYHEFAALCVPHTFRNEIYGGGFCVGPTGRDIISPVYAPGGEVTGRGASAATLRQQGIRVFSSETGRVSRAHVMILPNSLACAAGTTHNMGQLACFCPPPPLEIGNRVWTDYDLDGEQDPGEPPIAGVTVELVSGSSVIATAITDARGEYYFSGFSGSDTANAKYNLAIPGIGVSVRIPNADGAQQAPLVGLVLTPSDQGSDDRLDSDAILNGDDAVILVDTTPGVINHTYDFGFAPDDWDLALRKSVPVQYVAAGSNVVFTIDIFNQGAGPIDNIEIVDYVPANLSVNDANWTPNTLTGPGTVTRTLTAGNELPSRGLWPGESVGVDISMDVAGGLADNTVIVNKAEIASMTSTSGAAIVDIDSTPDSTDDESNVKDDVINENGLAGGDEDDHDPAQITVTSQTDIYDLALRKRLAAGQSSVVNQGEDVLFTIEVFNQGTSAASNITLVDRYPTGFTLSPNDATWTDQGTTATVDWSGTLQPGESTTVDILLRAGTTLGTLQNFAEINTDDGDDVDSTPGGDNSDTLLDDVISGNATANATDDEDDHDVAEVTVRRFDLALRKQLAAGQPTTTVKGADVTYVIDVFNQGSVDAFDISVVDYLTDTLLLSENDTNGWTLVETNQLARNIPGPLAPNGSERLTITLRISDTAVLGQLDNYAEIATASDIPAGPPAQDVDSAPDTVNGNDPLIDDEILNDGTNDQDDHDIASVTIGRFDLALIKEYVSDTSLDGNSTDGIIGINDQVVFRMTVTNQGDVPAYDIRVTDHNPEGIVADDSDPAYNMDNGWVTESMILNHNVLPGPLNPTESITIEITLRSVGPNSVLYPAAGLIGTHTNWAEISSAANLPGGPPVVDEDSPYDEDPANDAGGQPGSAADNYVDGNGTGTIGDGVDTTDEDDHDPAQVTVQNTFDLAVIKYLIYDDGTPNFDVPEVAAGDVITYEYYVENQGTETATGFTLIEHVPAGLILNDANWTPNNVAGPGTATRTYNTSLPPGEVITDTVLFQAAPDIQPGQVYTNIIEIESATNGAGLTDVDSDADSNATNETFVEDNQTRQNFRLNPAIFDEDDHDPAVVMAAHVTAITLTKSLNTPPTVTVGSSISFTIRITNTGSITITSLPMTDTYDTAHLSFDTAADLTGPNPATEPANDGEILWSNVIQYDADNQLAPNEVLDIIVWFNTRAETTNLAGGASTCDTAGHTYNNASAMGESTCVEVPIDPAEPKLTLGDLIWHDIDNDGIQDTNEPGIDGVLVYLWELDGSNNPILTSLMTTTTTTTNTVSGFYQFEVPSGNSYRVEVASSNFDPGGPLEGFVLGANQANITNDADPDQTAPNVTTNVDTLDFGFYCEFDLALVKTLAAGQPATIQAGDDVTFTLTVHNQGVVTATNVSLADYIPTGFTLNDGNWSGSGTGPSTVNRLLAGPLTPSGTANDSASVDIVLTAGATLSGTYTNTAEIITYTTSIVDGNGNPLPDVDSTPDDTDGNDSGETTALVDDEVAQDGKNGGDEDDHDPASITVTFLRPTLALSKQVNTTPNDPTFGVGETISYTIRITNTGSVLLTVVPLEDRYSDVFLTFVSASVPPDVSSGNGLLTWSDVTTALGNIAPGASVSLDVTFTTEADTTLLQPVAPCTEAGHTPNIVDVVSALADPDGDDGNSSDDVAVVKDADDRDCAEVQILNPTAVQLASSSISQTPDGVLVRWSMVSESDVVGFNIWKSNGAEAEMRSTEMIVATNAGQTNGASYQWLDAGATLNQGDTYVLELVHSDGSTERIVIDVMSGGNVFLPFAAR